MFGETPARRGLDQRAPLHYASTKMRATRPLVVFDLGGVLVSVDFMRACARLEAAGGAPAAGIFEAIVHGADKRAFETGALSAHDFAARCCAVAGVKLSCAEFAEIWCDIFDEQREVTRLLDQIALKADLVLLSNTDPLHIEQVRGRFDFLPKFQRLLLSYEIGYAKPARQIFDAALELAAPGTALIYFDDVPEFVDAARGCGLPAEQFVGVSQLKCDLERLGLL